MTAGGEPQAMPANLEATATPSPGAAPDRTGSMVPSIRGLAPRLIVSGALPLIGYSLLRPHVGSDATALLAVSVFPLLDLGLERRRNGRIEPIGMLALIGLATGAAGAFAFHGDATLLKLRESVLTGVFGIVCLATLLLRRPAMFYLGRAFSTGGDPAQVAEFDTLFDLPGAAGRFRLITAVWGVGLVAEAAVKVTMALTLSTQRFLLVAPIFGWTVLGGLLFYTTRFSRAGEARVLANVEATAPTSPAAG